MQQTPACKWRKLNLIATATVAGWWLGRGLRPSTKKGACCSSRNCRQHWQHCVRCDGWSRGVLRCLMIARSRLDVGLASARHVTPANPTNPVIIAPCAAKNRSRHASGKFLVQICGVIAVVVTQLTTLAETRTHMHTHSQLAKQTKNQELG